MVVFPYTTYFLTKKVLKFVCRYSPWIPDRALPRRSFSEGWVRNDELWCELLIYLWLSIKKMFFNA